MSCNQMESSCFKFNFPNSETSQDASYEQDEKSKCFKFNFRNPETSDMSCKQEESHCFRFNSPNSETSLEDQTDSEVDSVKTDWSDSVSFIVPAANEVVLKALQNAKKSCSNFTVGSYCIKHLISSLALEIAKLEGKCEDVLAAEARHSDLEPGIYEGGFKTWECSLDLATYLEGASCFAEKPKVLELGCGSGIPGLLAYLHGCDVTFQDFNKEVLEYLTIPNVYLNTPDNELSSVSEKCQFLSGHWQGIKAKFYENSASHEKYDVILSSETIYSKSNQKHLLDLMKLSLNPNGIIYLAAKTHYFGVGGTLHDFIALVDADGSLEGNVVYESTEGVQRNIVAIKYFG